MSESALDRVSRALDLIPFISRNPGLSVVQIAERFNSTPAQISKDLSLLHMCGLPGYSHLELLDINYEDPNYIAVTEAQVLDRPRSLTQIEAVTLVLGLQLLTELTTDPVESLAITNLQERIVESYGANLSSIISVTDAVAEAPLTPQVLQAISAERKLSLKYNSASSDSITSREVHPLEIYYNNGIGYLRAFDIRAAAERTFRLDRITELELGEKSTLFYGSQVDQSPHNMTSEVEIEMGADGYFFIERHNEIVTSSVEIPSGFRIKLSVVRGEWITRTLLGWPYKIDVLEPEALSVTIQARIAGALANYQ